MISYIYFRTNLESGTCNIKNKSKLNLVTLKA